MNRIKICTSINVSIEISQPKLDIIIREIRNVFIDIGQQLFQEVIAALNEAVIEWMESKTIKIRCNRCEARSGFTRRGFRKDGRGITTSIGRLFCICLQMIECSRCHYRFSPILQVLGIERYQRISWELKLKGVCAAIHLPYRLARNVLEKCTGIGVSVRTIWKEVQRLGPKINLGIDKAEEGSFGVDGTGVPIRDTGKRGKELKIIAQYRKNGSVKICGICIGDYKKGWEFAKEICTSIKETFKIPFMCGDGSVYKELKKYLRGILFQRDLWHIYHSLKHVLWEEGIKRSSDDYKEIAGKVFSIIKLPKNLTHEEIDHKKIKEKIERMESLIDRCKELGYEKICEYLDGAKKYLFTFANKKLGSRKLINTNSLIERIMREINFRIDVASAWSDQGALNITKLRLGVVYNHLELESLYVKE